MQQENLITKLKRNKATIPVLILSILLLILGVSLGIFFYKGKNEIMATTTSNTDVARNDMIQELNSLLSYLSELDQTVIDNQNTLGTVADYSTTYQNNLSDARTTIQQLESFICDYLENNEIPDENLKKCLQDILSGLNNTSTTLTENENTFLTLIEEYKTASDERKEEIEAELEKLYNSFHKDYEVLGTLYENLQKILASYDGASEELESFLTSLEYKLGRLLTTNLSTLMSLLENGTLNLSLKVDQGIEHLTEKMLFLHTAVSESQTTISELLTNMSNTDASSQETINQEFSSVKTNIEELNVEFQEAHSEVKKLLRELTEDMESLFDEQNELLEKSFKEHNTHLDDKLDEHDSNMTDSFSDQNTYLEETFADHKLLFEESMSTQTSYITKLYEQLESILQQISSEMETLLTEQFEEMMTTLTSMENKYMEALENYYTETIDNLTALNTNMSYQFQNMDSSISNQYQNLTSIVNTSDSELKTYLDSIYGDLSQRLNQVFQYVSNGKKLLASALLTKGVSCEADATFAEIYDAILSIKQTLVIGVEKIPGTIKYDYHYHTDVNGSMLHSATCSITQKGGCYTSPVYHAHTGSSSGGGCYTVAHTGYHTYSCGGANCTSGPHGPDSSGQVYYVGNCSGCGDTLSVYGSPGWTNCGKTTSVPYTYYTLGCGKTTSTIVAYKPACGLADGQMVGAHIVYEPAYTTGYNGEAQASVYSKYDPLEAADMDENLEPETEVPAESQEPSPSTEADSPQLEDEETTIPPENDLSDQIEVLPESDSAESIEVLPSGIENTANDESAEEMETEPSTETDLISDTDLSLTAP